MNNSEKKNNDSLLLRFKNFVKKNSIRIKAGAAATIVAGSIGVASWQLGHDDHTHDDPNPSHSQEWVDPSYNPDGEDDDHNHTINPGPTDTHKPGEDDEHDHSGDDDEHNHDHSGEGEDENVTPTGKPEDGTGKPEDETGKPGINHEHKYSAWKAVDGKTEIRTCECGDTQKRGHSLKTPTTSYRIGTEDTHEVVTTQGCSTCNYVKTTTTVENCHYNITSFDDMFEYKTCSDCGKDVKTYHILDEGTLNEDGTITYTCLNDGCTYVTTKDKEITPPIEHVHNYGDPVITYQNRGERGHVKVSTQECSEEGCPEQTIVNIDEKILSHVYGQGVNGKDAQGKDVVIYTCKDCGFEKVVERTHQGPTDPVEHTHNYSGEASISYEITDNGHIKVYTYTCIDPDCPNPGERKVVKSDEVKHNYDREHGVVSADGKTITYICECGDTITEQISKPPVQHTHKYDGEAEITYERDSEGHVKVYTYTCTDSGCPNPNDKKTVKADKVGHTYDRDHGVISEDGKTITYSCECGATITENLVHTHTYGEEKTTYKNITDEGHTEVTTKTCIECGESEVSETTISHSYVKVEGVTHNEKGEEGTLYRCACGHEKFVVKGEEPPVIHQHTFDEGTVTGLEDLNATHHIKVLVKTCTDPDCPTQGGYQKTERVTETHEFKNTGKTTTKGGITYEIWECACGRDKLVQRTKPPVEHQHSFDIQVGEGVVVENSGTAEGHKVTYTYKCKDCDKTTTKTVVEKHTNTTKSTIEENGVVYEVEKCADCGYEISRTAIHTHNYTTTKTDYEPYDDGHIKVLTKTCSEPGCPKPTVVEKAEKKDPHTETTAIVKDGEELKERTTCSDCGYLIGEKGHTHNLNTGTTVTKHDGTDHWTETTQTCQDEGCPEKIVVTPGIKVPHSFKPTGEIKPNENGEDCIEEACECGATRLVPKANEHDPELGEAVITYEDAGEVGHIEVSTKSCTVEGCADPTHKEVIRGTTPISHTYDETKGVESKDPVTGVVTITYTCTADGCNHTKTEIKHTTHEADYKAVPGTESAKTKLNESQHSYTVTMRCSVEGCTEHEDYTDTVEEDHSLGDVDGYNDVTKEETTHCKGCGAVVVVGPHTSHTYEDETLPNGSIYHECIWCGHNYTDEKGPETENITPITEAQVTNVDGEVAEGEEQVDEEENATPIVTDNTDGEKDITGTEDTDEKEKEETEQNDPIINEDENDYTGENVITDPVEPTDGEQPKTEVVEEPKTEIVEEPVVTQPEVKEDSFTSLPVEQVLSATAPKSKIFESSMSVEELLRSVATMEEILATQQTAQEIIEEDMAQKDGEEAKTLTKSLFN